MYSLVERWNINIPNGSSIAESNNDAQQQWCSKNDTTVLGKEGNFEHGNSISNCETGVDNLLDELDKMCRKDEIYENLWKIKV